jgi:hypothetical protein
MVTGKYESPVSVCDLIHRRTVIDLLRSVVMIDRERNVLEHLPWKFTLACNGPCESPA